jgi:hypothetical protein
VTDGDSTNVRYPPNCKYAPLTWPGWQPLTYTSLIWEDVDWHHFDIIGVDHYRVAFLHGGASQGSDYKPVADVLANRFESVLAN